MSSSAGILTELSAIRNSKALANLSFGQGDLMSTPVQVAALVNAIACGGEYRPLSLVKGLVDEEGNFAEQNEPVPARQVISERTAQLLEEYMISSVEYGTSVWGKPEHGQAAAKTATAETGLKVDDRRVVQAWFSGYYPVGNPLYTITILVEDGDGGGTELRPHFPGHHRGDLSARAPSALRTGKGRVLSGGNSAVLSCLNGMVRTGFAPNAHPGSRVLQLRPRADCGL